MAQAGFHEKAMQALERDPGSWHCIDCWAVASGLMSPEDKLKLGQFARTLATTSDPVSDIADCEKCTKKHVRAVRSISRE